MSLCRIGWPIAAVLVTIVAEVSVATAAEKEQDRFTLEGVLSIPSPGDGYRWKEVKTGETKGVKSHLLECRKEKSSTKLVLAVECRKANTSAQRLAAVKEGYRLFLDRLEKAGLGDLKKTRPSLRAPIPDRVEYQASGRDADGSPVEVRGVIVFGKNLYTLEATAATSREAAQLLRIAEVWEELDSGGEANVAGQVPPQAQPVAALLKAVRTQDPQLLKTVFSTNLRKEMELQGLESVLKVYERVFEDQFGKYDPGDFRFQYQGDADEGKVFVLYQGKRAPGLRVIREEGGWKVDER